MNNESFWALKVEGGGFPTVAFMSLDSARKRAEQLARQTRSRVFLLEAREVVVPNLPAPDQTEVQWKSLVSDNAHEKP